MADDDPYNFEVDIELCKVIKKIPFYGLKMSDKVCEDVDTSGEINKSFFYIMIVLIFIILFIIFLIFYFLFLQ